jgi:hypothetical protein
MVAPCDKKFGNGKVTELPVTETPFRSGVLPATIGYRSFVVEAMTGSK